MKRKRSLTLINWSIKIWKHSNFCSTYELYTIIENQQYYFDQLNFRSQIFEKKYPKMKICSNNKNTAWHFNLHLQSSLPKAIHLISLGVQKRFLYSKALDFIVFRNLCRWKNRLFKFEVWKLKGVGTNSCGIPPHSDKMKIFRSYKEKFLKDLSYP